MLLMIIPLDPEVRVGGDAGEPIVVAKPESQSAAALRQIAETFSEQVAAQSREQRVDAIPIEVIE